MSKFNFTRIAVEEDYFINGKVIRAWRPKTIEELGDALCNSYRYLELGPVCTNQYNQCEGSGCSNAYDSYLSDSYESEISEEIKGDSDEWYVSPDLFDEYSKGINNNKQIVTNVIVNGVGTFHILAKAVNGSS